jgi:hypothetical protein
MRSRYSLIQIESMHIIKKNMFLKIHLKIYERIFESNKYSFTSLSLWFRREWF